MDTVSRGCRSEIMRKVRSRDTGPELWIRREIHKAGFRYRVHDIQLAGKPDLVFPRYHLAVFVNGCFWHGHNCTRGARVPATNTEYWKQKIRRNRERDRESYRILRKLGWRVATIWECQLEKGRRTVLHRLRALRNKHRIAS